MKKVTFTVALIWAFCLASFVSAIPNNPSGSWELATLDGDAVGTSVPVTLNFLSGQPVAEGFGGCNEYNTLYYIIGADGIQFGSIATVLSDEDSLSNCDNASVTETAYFEALASTSVWVQNDQLLTLRDSDGADRLQFSSVDQATAPLAVMLNDVIAKSETTLLITLSLLLITLYTAKLIYTKQKR